MAARPERIASVYQRPCPFTVAALPLPAAILMRPPERETEQRADDGPRSTKGGSLQE